MVLEKRITSHEAERLLGLQNELDELDARSGPRRTLRTAGSIKLWNLHRVRELQRQIEAEDLIGR